MSSNNTFAYNTGSNINGTTQVGNIAYGVPSTGYDSTGLKWWAGPDEDLGYIIAKEDTAGQHVGGDNETAFLGFRRSIAKTEASFIELANNFTGQTFTTGDNAKTWLNNNGFWTSWAGQTTTPSSGAFAYTLVTLPYNPPSEGNIIFPNFSGGAGGAQGLLSPNTFATNAVWWNKVDSTGTDRSTDFNALIGQPIEISFTQNGNTAIYTTNGITLQGNCFNFSPNPNYNMVLVQASPVNFVAGQLVTIAYSF